MTYSTTYTVYEQNHFNPFEGFRDGELEDGYTQRTGKPGKKKSKPRTIKENLFTELGTIYADTHGGARNRFNSGRMAGKAGSYEQ